MRDESMALLRASTTNDDHVPDPGWGGLFWLAALLPSHTLLSLALVCWACVGPHPWTPAPPASSTADSCSPCMSPAWCWQVQSWKRYKSGTPHTPPHPPAHSRGIIQDSVAGGSASVQCPRSQACDGVGHRQTAGQGGLPLRLVIHPVGMCTSHR